MHCIRVHDKCPGSISLSPSLAASTSSLADDATGASPGAIHHLRSHTPNPSHPLSPSIPTISVPTERVTWTCFYMGHINTCTPFNRYATALASACLLAYAYACARAGRETFITRWNSNTNRREIEREREKGMELCNIASFAYGMRCRCYRCENVWHDLRSRSLSFEICIANMYIEVTEVIINYYAFNNTIKCLL